MKDYVILQVSALKEYFRDTEAIFWTLLFPLIFLLVFRLFDTGGAVNAYIAVIDEANNETTSEIVTTLQSVDGIGITRAYDSLDVAKEDLADSERLDFIILDNENGTEFTEEHTLNVILYFPEDYGAVNSLNPQISSAEIIYNDADEGQASPSSIVQSIIDQVTTEITLDIYDGERLFQIERNGVAVNEIGFYDFFVPGVIGLGLMQSGIIGIAFSMANSKEKGIFKRLSATPLPAWRYILAQVMTFLVVSVLQVTIMIVLALYLLNANIYGSISLLYILAILGSFVFLSIGFIIAAVTNSANAASGLANALTVPMMFLAGVFFPRDGFPEPIRTISEYLPLSPIIDAMRDVALLEATPADIQNELFIIAIWLAVSFVLAVQLFSFKEK